MILGSTLHYTSLLALINVYLFHWNGRHSSRPWPQCAFTLPSHFWYARRTILSDDLLACFPRPAALHTFSSTTSLVRPDIFLRLPPATNFTGQPVEGRTDFVSLTPATALEALLTARKTTYEQCPSSRESVEAGSLTADLHFALYCTPYYGYTPASESDFIAMTYALSDFLVYTCFTTTGEPNAALSNLSARPGDLLTILSTIHPAFLSVSLGDWNYLFSPLPPQKLPCDLSLLLGFTMSLRKIVLLLRSS